MTFKDARNRKCNQTGGGQRRAPLEPVHGDPRGHLQGRDGGLQPRLGQPRQVRRRTTGAELRLRALGEVVQTAVKYLDRVIDINYYPTDEASASNSRWRPVGLGCMGLQDVFFKMRLPFDSPEALELTARIQEHDLPARRAYLRRARRGGRAHEAFDDTWAADGKLQFDLWDVSRRSPRTWDELKRAIAKTRPAQQPPHRDRPHGNHRESSPAATSASSRRSRTCSSARPSRATSCRSTTTWSPT